MNRVACFLNEIIDDELSRKWVDSFANARQIPGFGQRFCALIKSFASSVVKYLLIRSIK